MIDKKLNELDKKVDRLNKELADMINEKYNTLKENNDIEHLTINKKSLETKLKINKEEMEFNIYRKKTTKYIIVLSVISLILIVGVPTIINAPVNHINVLSISLLVYLTYDMSFNMIEINSKIRKTIFDKNILDLELETINKIIEEIDKEEEDK